MIDKYKEMSPRRLLGTLNGDKERAVSIYMELHPDSQREDVVEDFDRAENFRSMSPLELLAAGSRFVGGYDQNDAVEDYLEMHPGENEEKLREQLSRALSGRRR